MKRRRLLTARVIKQTGSQAIRDLKKQISGSNTDVADLLGNCESTVRARLDEDDDGNQITVPELLRSLEKDEPSIARALLALVGWTAEPLAPHTIEDVFDVIAHGYDFVGETIHAHRTGTGIDPEQAKALMPKAEAMREELASFQNLLRDIIAEGER